MLTLPVFCVCLLLFVVDYFPGCLMISDHGVICGEIFFFLIEILCDVWSELGNSPHRVVWHLHLLSNPGASLLWS